MQVSTTFKRAFLHLMLLGLNGARSKGASAQERKRLIKISADAALAVARGRRAGWSRALLLAGARTPKRDRETGKCCCGGVAATSKWKVPASRKILRRSLGSCSRARSAKNNNAAAAAAVAASVVAGRMTKRRTRLLRELVPGGESLSSLSLLSETVDYVIHLQAQVNLMQCLAKALGASNLKSQMSLEFKKAAKVCGLEDGTN